MIRKVILLLVLSITVSNTFSQENIVKASNIIGNLGLQYERSLDDHFSIIGQIGYSKIEITAFNETAKSNGFGFYIEGRYYFSTNKDVMEGWHIGPYFNSINTKLKDNDDIKTNITSFGLSTGYQWVFDSQLTLEIIFGAGTLGIDSDIQEIEVFEDIGFLPHLGLTIGYNF